MFIERSLDKVSGYTLSEFRDSSATRLQLQLHVYTIHRSLGRVAGYTLVYTVGPLTKASMATPLYIVRILYMGSLRKQPWLHPCANSGTP